MKFGFVTCVQLGLSCMDAIYRVGQSLDLVITLNDSQARQKSGRVYLDDFCNKHQIPLHKSNHINDESCIAAIKEHKIDWLFIIGWSQIANSEILNAPNNGVLGMHPTLLPKGRGRAAIPWAIIKGLNKTGVTLFKLDTGVDTGEIIAQKEILLDTSTTAASLYTEVNRCHIQLIEEVINPLSKGDLSLRVQDESKATMWPGRKPEDGEINLKGSVVDAEKLVRAVTKPYPGAFYFDSTGNKVIVWEAEISKERFCSVNDKTHLQFYDGILVLNKIEVARTPLR